MTSVSGSPPLKRSLKMENDETDIEATPLSAHAKENMPSELRTEKEHDDGTIGDIDSSTETERYLVWWEEPADKDPENPLNWSMRRKPLASSMLAPGVPEMMAEFGTSDNQIATFVVSVFMLGFALGPILLAPLSELYGRLPIYHVCNVLFVIFSVGCAVAQNVGMLISFRFLAGSAGVAVVTCGSGSIADMMPPEKRGRAMSVWSLGPLLGPIVGPICAGFLVEAAGWRWVFWVITIVSGVVTFAAFFILRETYAPVLLERKAARLRKETGNNRYQPKMAKKGTPQQLFRTAIIRPARMFCCSVVVMAMCLYVATLYGFLYILVTTFTFVYRDVYGFSATGAGLSFIGGGVGNILGLVYVGFLSDRIIQRQKDKGKEPRPEDRLSLILTVPCSLILPLGLVIYGWTADKHLHWILPMIGNGIMSFGMIGIVMSVQTYLVDAYTAYAASVTAASSVPRSLLAALLPLCGLQIYDTLGLGWGNTLLGLLCLGLAPVPWLLCCFGERMRKSSRFRQEF
ncbi:hypothetical protein AAE478_009009 [Parahypoxylon ruwenzoriense]